MLVLLLLVLVWLSHFGVAMLLIRVGSIASHIDVVAYQIGVVISCWCCQSQVPCGLNLVRALLTLVLLFALVLFLFPCLIWYVPPSYHV
jgi:hypothetical protein